jgi:nitrate reductase delta subunit
VTDDLIVGGYRLIADLLLHPDERAGEAGGFPERLEGGPPGLIEPIAQFLADPLSASRDEYVRTLELEPACPLYLGAHLFDEPSTCRNVGSSPRNGYMLELGGIYRHFGLELDTRELPDYLPVVADFLAMSLDMDARDRIGLRRRLLERYVRPALDPLREKLEGLESPYARLIAAMSVVVAAHLTRLADRPAWSPPDRPEPAIKPLKVVRKAFAHQEAMS